MARVYIALVAVGLFKKTSSDEQISLKCTPEFCDDYVQRFPCPPLDPACSYPNISLVIPSATPCNCCEQCFLFQDLNEDCVVGRPGDPLPKVMCKPGTKCQNGKCKKMDGPDPDFYEDYECEGEKCYCTVIENNAPKKIFGTFDKKDVRGEKQCACSIFAFYARKSINKILPIPDTFLAIPRCLPNGQFDPLQCFGELCGCVNGTTGTWDSTVRRVPVVALGPRNPRCFDGRRHKVGQYYKSCEKERNNLMSDISWENLGEISLLLSHAVQCTPDGEYVH